MTAIVGSLMLVLAVIFAQPGPAAETRIRAVYVTPPGMPAFQPDLQQAIADRMKVDFVMTRLSPFDRTQLYLPTALVQDICRDTRLPRVVSANAITSSPTNASSSQMSIAVSVYDCVNDQFIAVAQANTAPAALTNQAAMNNEYRAALKRLLGQLSPPVPGRSPAPSPS